MAILGTPNLRHRTSPSFETPFPLLWNITMCQAMSHSLSCSTVGYRAQAQQNQFPALGFIWNNHVVRVCRVGLLNGGQSPSHCLRCFVRNSRHHGCSSIQLFHFCFRNKGQPVKHKKMHVFISFIVCLTPVFMSVSFTVRLHDSISEEGFHYLVFDL